jgi:hypothetical protein
MIGKVIIPALQMAPQSYLTFAIRQPMVTHFRVATCAEVECQAYLGGWQLRVEQLSDMLLHTARNAGKKFMELEVSETEHYLVFEPGQPCFSAAQHRAPLERPAFFYAGRGHWSSRIFSTRTAQKFNRPEDWAERMDEHLDRIRVKIQEG